jgi:hypothetical protein
MSQYFTFVEKANPIVKFKKDIESYKYPVYYIWWCDEQGNELKGGIENGYIYFLATPDELKLQKAKYSKLGYDVAVYNK